MYSAQLLDHFQNPRHAGELNPASVSVQVQNPACGDILRLTANIENGHIVEVRFKAKGCVPAMACGSVVAELLTGKTTAEAKKISRDEIVKAIGGLPEASSHAAHLAFDATAALLKNE